MKTDMQWLELGWRPKMRTQLQQTRCTHLYVWIGRFSLFQIFAQFLTYAFINHTALMHTPNALFRPIWTRRATTYYILVVVGVVVWQLPQREAFGLQWTQKLSYTPEDTTNWALSLQTFLTIGYGGYSPSSFLANITCFWELVIGLVITALVSGLPYLKFSLAYSGIEMRWKRCDSTFCLFSVFCQWATIESKMLKIDCFV